MDTSVIDLQWYKTIPGIVIGTMFIVNVLKRMIGNVTALERIPTWAYSIAIACVLTYVASYFGVLMDSDDSIIDRLMTAALSAASASGFFTWYHNPKDAIGDSEPAVKASRFSASRKASAVLLAVALAGVSACGAGAQQSARHRAVVADTAVAESIFAIQDIEETLHVAGVIDAAQHREFNKRLLPLLETGQKFNRAIRAWDPSQPMPVEVRNMIPQFKVLLDHVVSSLTKDDAARSRILEKIAIAQAAVLAALSFLPQGV
jgi:hypothetical protein